MVEPKPQQVLDIKAGAKQISDAGSAYIKANAALRERVKNGGKVTPEDFQRLDTVYDTIAGPIQKALSDVDPNRRDMAYQAFFNAVAQYSMQAHPQDGVLLDKMAQEKARLVEGFQRDYVAGKKQPDFSQVTPHLASDESMIDALLGRFKGAAIADDHTQDEPMKWLAQNAKTLKQKGLGTVYFEHSKILTDKLDKLNEAEWKQLLTTRQLVFEREGTREEIYLQTAAQNAQLYQEKMSDDHAMAFAQMYKALKDNGIRLVNLDSEDSTRELLGLEQRVAMTNYKWLGKIQSDRQSRPGAENEPFLVLGGLQHFIGEGLVDNALGLPVISWMRGDKAGRPVVMRAGDTLVNEAQREAVIGVPGGLDYRDLNRAAAASYYHEIASRLEAMDEKAAVAYAKSGRMLADIGMKNDELQAVINTRAEKKEQLVSFFNQMGNRAMIESISPPPTPTVPRPLEQKER